MSTAFHAFLARHPTSTDEVRAAVSAALTEARRAWPDIDVTEEAFGAALASRVDASVSDLGDAVRALRTDDLYLALGCAMGSAAALRAFEERYVPEFRRALAKIGFTPSSVDEAVQAARVSLLVAGDKPAGMLEYRAEGPLRGWLRVVVTRLAFRGARGGRKPGDRLEVEALAALGSESNIEIEYLRREYGETFKEAFREALASLSVKERLILKQRFALQMTTAELGGIHRVNASSVSRWISDARFRLLSLTRDKMMARLGVGRSDVSSILRLIHHDMDLSLSTYRDPAGK